MRFTAAEIAERLQGTVRGNGAVVLTGFAPADQAGPGDLTFAENENYLQKAVQSAASAVLVPKDLMVDGKVLICVADARVAFAKVLPLFYPFPEFAPGVHETAVVASSAKVDASVHIGPYCVVGEGVNIGAGSVLEGTVHVGDHCQLGEAAHLSPQVTVYSRSRLGNRVRIHAGSVIGADGFGYVFHEGKHLKIPQVGDVLIEDDVEIGANVTIDRGALGSTVIGRGTKIDNLVQIAHNVVVGEHCILVAQVGISGSTRLGNFVTLAGQVGLAGHLEVGDRATVAAKSGVMHNIPGGEMWLGIPAQENRKTKRQIIAVQRLPDLLHRVNDLEKRLKNLARKTLGPGSSPG